MLGYYELITGRLAMEMECNSLVVEVEEYVECETGLVAGPPRLFVGAGRDRALLRCGRQLTGDPQSA